MEAILGGWQYRDRAEIDAIAKAAVDYQGALASIGEAHAALFAKRDDIDSEELQRVMTSYAREIRSAVETLRKL